MKYERMVCQYFKIRNSFQNKVSLKKMIVSVHKYEWCEISVMHIECRKRACTIEMS
jgi:hypothetical protein